MQTSGHTSFEKCPVSGRSRGGDGVGAGRCAGEGEPDEWPLTHGEAKVHPSSGEDGGRLIEQLAEGLHGAGPMR